MNKSANPDTKSVTADLGEQIEALRSDLTKLAAAISEDVSEGIGKAGEQVSQTGRDAHASATRTVTEHPLAAVGIAAAAGVMLGMMLRKG